MVTEPHWVISMCSVISIRRYQRLGLPVEAAKPRCATPNTKSDAKQVRGRGWLRETVEREEARTHKADADCKIETRNSRGGGGVPYLRL